MNRTVSTCCGEAVVVRGDDKEGTNWYECVKCGNACDVREKE